MNHSLQKREDIHHRFKFVPEEHADIFIEIVTRWYLEFCTDFSTKEMPRPYIISNLMMHRGFINEPDEIFTMETGLSWFAGTVLEIRTQSEEQDDASLLDLSVAEIVDLEDDMAVVLDYLNMAYMREGNNIKHNPICEVW